MKEKQRYNMINAENMEQYIKYNERDQANYLKLF